MPPRAFVPWGPWVCQTQNPLGRVSIFYQSASGRGVIISQSNPRTPLFRNRYIKLKKADTAKGYFWSLLDLADSPMVKKHQEHTETLGSRPRPFPVCWFPPFHNRFYILGRRSISLESLLGDTQSNLSHYKSGTKPLPAKFVATRHMEGEKYIRGFRAAEATEEKRAAQLQCTFCIGLTGLWLW